LVVDRKPQALGRVRRRRIAVGHRIGERIVEREQLEKLKTGLLRGIAEQIRCLNTNRRRIERVASEKFDKRYFGATR
jgi:predicted ABC-type ATPase